MEERFQPLLSELCSGVQAYLLDIEAVDLEGRCDAAGTIIPAPVARGLVRRLREGCAAAPVARAEAAAAVPGSSAAALEPHRPAVGGTAAAAGREAGSAAALPSAKDGAAAPCSLSLCRGTGAFSSEARLSVRGQLPRGGGQRRKVLTAVLDNSASMRREWPLVADAVARVITDEVLADPLTAVAVVVYNSVAVEVPIRGHASELPRQLQQKFAPTGITNFREAFKLAETVIRRELGRHLAAGARACEVDITTLIFTDGQDTSLPPLGKASRQSAQAARDAGDKFRAALRKCGCAAHTCVAAFGEHHDPEQCQHLSDRYYYINRQEVLSEWLAGGLGELLQSSGHCSLHLELPPGVALEEPLPTCLRVDADRCVACEVWLTLPAGAQGGTLAAEVRDAEGVALRGATDVVSACAPQAGSLQEHLFLVDSAELRLRQVALELRGRRPSRAELALLRERLVGAREQVQPLQEVVMSAAARLSGRLLLRERLAELDARSKRLSYALGHFDEQDQDTRQLGTVGIDAVLRDASQHVPLAPNVAALASRIEEALALPPPEVLSSCGRAYAVDPRSGHTAQELAEQGDALFFGLRSLRLSPDGGLGAAEDGDCLVGYEAFQVSGSQPPALGAAGVSHLGIPLYATAGHFERAMLLLPHVLSRLSPNSKYVASKSEWLLLGILGRALAAAGEVMDAQAVGLLHRARSVHAVLERTRAPEGGGSLLDAAVAEAASFATLPGERRKVADLYAVVAAGLLAPGWPCEQRAQLGRAVAQEGLRRAVEHRLQGAGEEERLWLVWGLLGPADAGEGWLEEPLTAAADLGPLHLAGGGFDPFGADAELESLHAAAPASWAPREAGAVALRSILAAQPDNGTPGAAEWATLQVQLSAWGEALQQVAGPGGPFEHLDASMTSDDVVHERGVRQFASKLRGSCTTSRLRDALPDPDTALASIAAQCLQGVPDSRGASCREEGSAASAGLPPRRAAAAALRRLVARRATYARKHTIAGAAFPGHAKLTEARMCELWGAPAAPVDEALYAKVYQSVSGPTTLKAALADKEYRRRGGSFAFSSRLDTFVEGLHRRTRDLQQEWRGTRRSEGRDCLRELAVEEMLLRLRWDDSDARARANLSKMVAQIWAGLEGYELEGGSVPSALWLDGASDAGNGGVDDASGSEFVLLEEYMAP